MADYQWFKLWHDVRTDAKLRALTGNQHRVWLHLLIFASEQQGEDKERGAIVGYDDDLLAVEVADGDTDLMHVTIERLIRLRMLEVIDGGYRFLKFNKRQADTRKPSDQPEQTRERKQRSRANPRDTTPDGEMSRDVTPVSRPVTPKNKSKNKEIEREEEVSPKGEDSSVSFGADAPSQPSSDASTTVKPRKATKTPAATPEPRPRNEWWDALVEVFGYEPLTPTERSKWGKVVKDIKACQATGADVRRAKANYDAGVASGAINWTLYPTSISSHLGELLSGATRAPTPSRPRANQNGHRPVTAATASRPILTADDAMPEGY